MAAFQIIQDQAAGEMANQVTTTKLQMNETRDGVVLFHFPPVSHFHAALFYKNMFSYGKLDSVELENLHITLNLTNSAELVDQLLHHQQWELFKLNYFQEMVEILK